jgi:hypothetical protein
MKIIRLDTTCVLSERWPVEPFDGEFVDPRFHNKIVTFRVGFDSKRNSVIEQDNHTVIIFKHWFSWGGDEEGFANWGRGQGIEFFPQMVSQLVNRLIDIVQTAFIETDGNPFPHLRHIGIRDFILLDTLYGERLQNFVSIGDFGMDSRSARRSIGILSKVIFPTEVESSNEKTKIIRAVELLNSGYHTEALLISFAILDNSVDEAIKIMCKENGISDVNKTIKSIHLKRRKISELEKKLGPILKRLTGYSLVKEQELWRNLVVCTGYRNDAIHDSIDVSYKNAKLCIETVRDILSFLNNIPRKKHINRLTKPYVPNLNLKKLPFLLEYK